MNWSFERVLSAGLGLAAAGVLAVGIVQHDVVPRLVESERQVAHGETILGALSNFAFNLDQAPSLVAQFVISGNEEHLRRAQTAMRAAGEQERQLRTLLAGDTIAIRSLDGLTELVKQRSARLEETVRIHRTRGANAALEQLRSWPTDPFWESIHNNARQMIVEQRAARDRLHLEAQAQWRSARRWSVFGFAVALTALLAAWVIVLREARRRSQLEQTLLKEQLLFRTLLAHIPMGVYFKDAEGRFTRVSARLAAWAGVPDAASMVGSKASDFLSAELSRSVQAEEDELARSGRPESGREVPLPVLNGQPRWALSCQIPLHDPRKRFMGTVGVLMDITARKQDEQARESDSRRLAEWARDLEARNHEEALIGEMSELLQTCADEEQAGSVLSRFMPAFFPRTAGILALTKSSRNQVEAIATWGGPDSNSEAVFAPSHCWALRRGHPHHAGRERLQPACEHLQRGFSGYSLCVPMMAHGESIGVLHLASEADDFSGAQRQLALTLAERAGLALANLRLREALRVQSIRDPLTGLYNRRYMEECFEREMRRAASAGRSLAVAMIDLDYFKRFNDSFGHEAGDLLLKEFGGLLQSRTRREDIACRYGGEEFVLLLPEMSAAAACRRADELREAVSRLSLSFHGQPLGRVTASIGVAVFPEHGEQPAPLIRAADTALYQAKQRGRDQVALAGAESIELERVAVGTAIAGRPPHGSVRALLTHTALTLDTSVKAHAGIGMQDVGYWNPPFEEPVETLPV